MALHRFIALGPFDVPKFTGRDGRSIDFDNATHAVFEKAKKQQSKLNIDANLDLAIGCYLLCLSPPGTKKVWPYYVGQACRQTIKERIFQKTDKVKKFNAIVNEYSKAKILVYLLPLFTETGRLAKKGSNQRKIDRAEYELIGICARKNSALWNVKHKAGLESFYIDGVHNEVNTESANQFREAIGMNNSQSMDFDLI